MQGVYAALLKAADKVKVPQCWDDMMTEQRKLGMFGLHNLAWHPDLVEAGVNTEGLPAMMVQGEFMVSRL